MQHHCLSQTRAIQNTSLISSEISNNQKPSTQHILPYHLPRDYRPHHSTYHLRSTYRPTICQETILTPTTAMVTHKSQHFNVELTERYRNYLTYRIIHSMYNLSKFASTAKPSSTKSPTGTSHRLSHQSHQDSECDEGSESQSRRCGRKPYWIVCGPQ